MDRPKHTPLHLQLQLQCLHQEQWHLRPLVRQRLLHQRLSRSLPLMNLQAQYLIPSSRRLSWRHQQLFQPSSLKKLHRRRLQRLRRRLLKTRLHLALLLHKPRHERPPHGCCEPSHHTRYGLMLVLRCIFKLLLA